jgi:hypothetical protein
MMEQRYVVYCFSMEKMQFAPMSYPTGGDMPFAQVLTLGAWVHHLQAQNKGDLPKSFPAPPKDFKPRILSYATLKPIDLNMNMDRLRDNVFVILMPEFAASADLQLLELILDARYRDHLRKNNIKPQREQTSEDILEVKPSFWGVGINFNALWRKLFGRSS